MTPENPAGTFPCPACQQPVPIDRSECPSCRLPFRKKAAAADAQPGSPLVGRLERRKRISEHTYLPEALRGEWEARREAQLLAARRSLGVRVRIILTAAALTSVPYFVPSLFFFPGDFPVWRPALQAFGIDAGLGALVGLILVLIGSTTLRGTVLFGLAFGAGIFAKARLGYPLFHVAHVEHAGPGILAVAVIGLTFCLTLFVAGILSHALDERPLD